MDSAGLIHETSTCERSKLGSLALSLILNTVSVSGQSGC